MRFPLNFVIVHRHEVLAIPHPPSAIRHPRKPADQSLKETAESVVVAFILAFIFRAFIVEAFVIPTGSMAPTLLGQHVRAVCPQCGYAFKSDGGDRSTAGADLRCPMCFFPISTLDDAGQPERTYAGDRILVQKYLYPFVEPRRYDVVVFKNPESPETNFIKRLVGLPNETLGFLDGNVYTKPSTGGDWRIASKVDPEINPRWEAIQRDVFQPIYHSRYVPKDGGSSEARGNVLWAQPWKPVAGDWQITNDPNTGTVFQYTPNADAEQGEASGTQATQASTLRFDFRPTTGYRADYSDDFAQYAYNQPNGSGLTLSWLEDVRIAATVRVPANGAGRVQRCIVRFVVLCRIDGEPEPIEAYFFQDDSGQGVSLTRADGTELESFPLHWRTLLHPEYDNKLEFWVVDQTFVMFANGDELLRHQLEIPFDQLLDRPAPPRPSEQQIEITVSGGPATITDLQLDRDLVYDDGGLVDRHRGSFPRDHQGNVARRHASPVDLGPDQFFTVGDNSPASQDSRKWASVNREVADAHFDGERGADAQGRVPRDLLMGRAFFVYYPAPSPVVSTGPAIIPNFGEMRFIH
ncbi:MAG: S26 family signal peptidase [Planctomycetota bacterium]